MMITMLEANNKLIPTSMLKLSFSPTNMCMKKNEVTNAIVATIHLPIHDPLFSHD
ncbi:hypothetical protein JCM16418A_40940 [Paenibacillus pini]